MNDVSNVQEELFDRHLDELIGVFYIDGQLERKRAQEISSHARCCLPCWNLLNALECESRLLIRALMEEDEPLSSRLVELY